MRATAIGLVAIILTITVAWTSLNASANTSGPDPSGYTWTDSNAPAPFIAPNFIDISTTGTLIATWDGSSDDGTSDQALPFGFDFFGNTYNSVQISTNGFISFTATDPSDCNQNYNRDSTADDPDLGNPIPHDDADCADDFWGLNPLIAGWFDDLDSGECGGVYYGTNGSAPTRMFIVQWDDVCHNNCDGCAAGEGVTFEVILYEGSNDIKIEYADGYFAATMPLENNGASATSGLSFDGTTGLPYSHAQQVLTSNLAVLYSPGTPVTATPTASPTGTPTEAPTASATATATPTSPPAGQTVLWGDVDCSGGVSIVDSLKLLRSDAGLDVTQAADCPEIGQQVQITPQ